MSAPIVCRVCGSSSADGGQFQALLPYRAVGVSEVADVDDAGLILRGIDRGDAEHFYAALLTCIDCGHEWTTSREWRHDHGGHL